jgi:cyanophycin synthetase
VTEVNSQPQISPLSRPDMFDALLRELMDGDGRIPVALVLGDGDGAVEAAVRSRLAKAGIRAGLISDRQVSIGAEELAQGEIDPIQAATAVMLDPTVSAIVMFTNAVTTLEDGLPFDRIDVLAIADGLAASDELPAFLSLARPYLQGMVLAIRGDPATGLIARFADERSLRLSDTRANLARGLAKAIAAQTSGG